VSRTVDTIITDSPSVAAKFCSHGRTVAFPTETVYGVGARMSDETAIRRVYEIKGRPADNPLIAHVSDASRIVELASAVPEFGERLIERFMPGPLTLVLDRHPDVAGFAFAGRSTIAVRVPAHELARDFLAAVGEAVVAPSANRSGRPSPTRWEDVIVDLGGSVDCILRGEPSSAGLESTVVDCTGKHPFVLRPGSVTLDDLRSVVPDTSVTSTIELLSRSPGTRYRHYAPHARVILVDRPPAHPEHCSAYIGLDDPPHREAWIQATVCGDEAAYGARLYAALRDADLAGCTHVYCQRVQRKGIGVAIMDRLERAASTNG
jgi:L-threonylcarbamoyladenylate synthase